MIRVLYLPVDKTEPEFTWLPVETKRGRQVPKCEVDFDLTQRRDTWSECCARGCRESGDGTYHAEDCYSIHAFTHQDSHITTRDARPNRCIEQLTDGEIAHWRGPVFAFGSRSLGSGCKDLDTTAFKIIVDRICRSERLKDSKVIQGVRINCDGYVKKYKQPQFERGTIRMHANMHGEVLWKEDLPRLVFGHGLSVYRVRTEEDLDARNPVASLLGIPCAKDVRAWGYYKRQKWGNCLVIRDDGKPLEPNDVEVFCRWIDKDLRKQFNAARKIDFQVRKTGQYTWEDVKKAIDDVQDKITMQRFLKFRNARVEEDSTDEEMHDLDMEDDGESVNTS